MPHPNSQRSILILSSHLCLGLPSGLLLSRFPTETPYALLLSPDRDEWVPVTTAWRVHRLRMEERPADMEGSCEYIEKQSRTADRGGPPAWGLGEVLTPPGR